MSKIIVMKTLIICLFVACGFSAMAQPSDFKALGDKSFNNKDYYEAAFYYEKAAGSMGITASTDVPFQQRSSGTRVLNSDDRAYIIYQLAQSYRLYENYIKALPWYQSILKDNQESKFPDTRLYYGICMRATANFPEAVNQLNQYLTTHQQADDKSALAKKEISDCMFAMDQYKNPVLAQVTRLKGSINGDGSNYSLIEKNGNVWFTSSRKENSNKQRINKIYFASNGNEPVELVIADEKSAPDAEYGTPALSARADRLYVTRWHKQGSTLVREIILFSKSGQSWDRPLVLNSNVNVAGYRSMQPHITADGRQLYYVSDRPGGSGGYDIWVSNLNTEGQAIDALNLGPKVNTNRDEQGPYYDAKQKRLVFSSKGHVGLGGFDLFETYQTNSSWSKPLNLGVPVNSPKDDLYYWISDQKDKFYVSSDRDSECCLEQFEGLDQHYVIQGRVLDCDSQRLLPGIIVSLQDSVSKVIEQEFTTSNSGTYHFDIRTNKHYRLLFQKPGYFSRTMAVRRQANQSTDTLASPELCLQSFTVGKPVVIKNILYDYGAATLRPESKVVLNKLAETMQDNPLIKIELGSHTDNIGSNAYNNKLSLQRAQECAAYMQSRGISKDRIFVRGYGESRPVAPNTIHGKDNPIGRQLNRRTEFTVLKMD